MKFALLTLGLLSMSAFLFTATGCSTDQVGTTDTVGTYSTHVDATPDKATTAAGKACEDLKLNNINSNGTKVDGKVTATTAQGQDVTINIEQAGENVSKVSIRVGATGDEAVSKQLVDRLRSHLSWF
jgi:phage-related protein